MVKEQTVENIGAVGMLLLILGPGFFWGTLVGWFIAFIGWTMTAFVIGAEVDVEQRDPRQSHDNYTQYDHLLYEWKADIHEQADQALLELPEEE